MFEQKTTANITWKRSPQPAIPFSLRSWYGYGLRVLSPVRAALRGQTLSAAKCAYHAHIPSAIASARRGAHQFTPALVACASADPLATCKASQLFQLHGVQSHGADCCAALITRKKDTLASRTDRNGTRQQCTRNSLCFSLCPCCCLGLSLPLSFSSTFSFAFSWLHDLGVGTDLAWVIKYEQ